MPEASLTLPAELSSVGEARAFLRRVLGDWDVDAYDFGAAQVLTELATNAALHARTAYTVHLVLEPSALLLEVTDSSPVPPQQRNYGTDATTGRGIALVDALSSDWGVESSPTGKTVWCRVAADDDTLERRPSLAESLPGDDLRERPHAGTGGHAGFATLLARAA